MPSKKERTREFILDRVSPVLNRNGYAGTSMSDIVKVTGLTKGSVYGNFENKEELALQAFNHNIKKVMNVLTAKVDPIKSPVGKLKGITAFYRRYYDLTYDFGGCPLVNIGVDANHQNPLLLNRVKDIIRKLHNRISEMIMAGIEAKELKRTLDPEVYSRRIFAMIEGSVFMSTTMKQPEYMQDMMDHIDHMIDSEMKC